MGVSGSHLSSFTTQSRFLDHCLSDGCLLAENTLSFGVRGDLPAGGLLILLLCTAGSHFTMTDYREPPFTCRGMLWCDKRACDKWHFVCLVTFQRRRPWSRHKRRAGYGGYAIFDVAWNGSRCSYSHKTHKAWFFFVPCYQLMSF